MTTAEMIADLVLRGYGVYIDSGNDGEDMEGKPWTYHVTVTRYPRGTGEGWHQGALYDYGMYGHDWEEVVREIYEDHYEEEYGEDVS